MTQANGVCQKCSASGLFMHLQAEMPRTVQLIWLALVANHRFVITTNPYLLPLVLSDDL